MGEQTITVPAPAKLNLFLEVLGKRADGYHEIETLMQTVDLADSVEIRLTGRGIHLERQGIPVPCAPEEDLAARAARAFLEAAPHPSGIEIRVLKRIPPGAGLGGGSSDGAAVLRALNRLCGEPLDATALSEMAASLGSDVPFFLIGGTAIARGRGERITPLDDIPLPRFLLALPHLHVSTASVYRNLRLTGATIAVQSALWELRPGNKLGGGAAFHNRLEDSVFEVEPRLARLKARLEEVARRRFTVTGSGSGLFSVLADEEDGGQVQQFLAGQFDGVLRIVLPARRSSLWSG
ncbi:MAG: 4-(cytidine 5'-diphospho)-2-C-methyl-D-erythritol kinase [Planctomycetota bacterium]